jgi:hypothetical protein
MAFRTGHFLECARLVELRQEPDVALDRERVIEVLADRIDLPKAGPTQFAGRGRGARDVADPVIRWLLSACENRNRS